MRESNLKFTVKGYFVLKFVGMLDLIIIYKIKILLETHV